MDHTELPDVPDEDAFRALARSSPWRWRTLRFIRREVWPRPPRHQRGQEVRAWLQRPDRLRVEQLDTGELLAVNHQGPQGGGWLTTDGGQPRAPLPATDTAPEYRPDGLVARRPFGIDTDAPMFGGYQWVAMLDPVELADGRDDQPGTDLVDLAASEHHGRPVWDAVVTPRDGYDPRCPCCPLLLHTETDMPPPPRGCTGDDTSRPSGCRDRGLRLRAADRRDARRLVLRRRDRSGRRSNVRRPIPLMA